MEFIEDFSNNKKFDPKFQAKLKPIFYKTVEFYISIELPKNESNRWPIKFYLKFQNEDYFTPLTDMWNILIKIVRFMDSKIYMVKDFD